MMFASKTPRDLNRDPQPILLRGYRNGDKQMRFSNDDAPWHQPWMEHAIYDPRPEFDHVQHNQPNPILVKFREVPEDSRWSWWHGFLEASTRVYFAAWSESEVAHARSVLSRLARVARSS